ncbi:MAG: hypothetical protein AB7P17_12740 [Nitrospirales bacterium]|nr:hypothetical protein [Nitrospirales bacterium]
MTMSPLLEPLCRDPLQKERSFRPFYFTVVFWGAEHRGYFTDLLLASLLSPRNIPALNKARRNKFLIVTTLQDWTILQDHALFQLLCQYVEPVFFEMPFPEKHDQKMLVMSRGHKLVSMKAYEDEAYGVYVTPDLILSDGSVAAMEQLAEQGRKVVLCVAIRFRQETMLPVMEERNFLKQGQPLAISSRELMGMALQNLHSETLRYEFEAPHFADFPISVYWWASPDKGMIIHSFSWAPLVVDYGALEHHDTQTFDNWTLDGDYIHRNFPNPDDVYVVTDSDEISLVSFTKESDLHFDLIPEPTKSQYGVLSHDFKVGLIRSLKDSLIMDPLKRTIFPQGVFLHSEEITPEWNEAAEQSTRVIRHACRPPTLSEQFHLDVIEQSTNSRFARNILSRLQTNSSERLSKEDLHKYYLLWVWVIRPRRFLLRMARAIGNFLRPISNQISQLLWFYRYRRFLWWRLKEKLGLVPEQGFDWKTAEWAGPGLSPVCPWFTLKEMWRNRRWFWRYRRYVWWRLKEKLHLVESGGNHWQHGGWDTPAISFLYPVFTVKWFWRNRADLWKSKHRLGTWVKEHFGFWRKRSKNETPGFKKSNQTRKIS